MPKKIMSDKDVEALNKIVEWHANNEDSRVSLTPSEATFDLIHNAPHPLFDPLELIRWDDQSGGLYRHRITGCYVYAWETTGGFDTHTLDDDDDVPEKEEPAVKVIFRIEESGNAIAFFPEEMYNHEPHLVTMYAHIGQHGSAHVGYYTQNTKAPRTPEELEEARKLRQELIHQGYTNLEIRQKWTQSMDEIRKEKIKERYG